MVAYEAVEVAALPFPSNASIVFIDILEPFEPSISQLSFACEVGTNRFFMFASAPAECGTVSGTAGKTLGVNGAVSAVPSLLGLVAVLASRPAERGLSSQTSSPLIHPLPIHPFTILSFHSHTVIPVLKLSIVLPFQPLPMPPTLAPALLHRIR
jgi:hypothetical protein